MIGLTPTQAKVLPGCPRWYMCANHHKIITDRGFHIYRCKLTGHNPERCTTAYLKAQKADEVSRLRFVEVNQ